MPSYTIESTIPLVTFGNVTVMYISPGVFRSSNVVVERSFSASAEVFILKVPVGSTLNSGCPTPYAHQRGCMRSTSGNYYDDYFGWADPDEFDVLGNILK